MTRVLDAVYVDLDTFVITNLVVNVLLQFRMVIISDPIPVRIHTFREHPLCNIVVVRVAEHAVIINAT